MSEGQSKMPVGKISRAGKFLKTGMKVGGNYIKHYSRGLMGQDPAESSLHEDNARDIYQSLSELKGSALKVAQMLSLDRGVLPEAFAKEFSQAQHKAPPMSAPLVVKTFRQHFGQSPDKLYDTFELQSVHAASIGQVHQATKDGHLLAVKIQYPGVGDSVVSDLNLARPLARTLFGWKDMDLDIYFEEVQARLLEETNYPLELQRGQEISAACAGLEGITFPRYFPELSGPRVLTMSWIEGQHLEEYLAGNPGQEERNRAGQALWDFYNFQIHTLRKMHADAHPGNFLFLPGGKVAVLDFGCVKEIPEEFYQSYLALIQPGILENDAAFEAACIRADILRQDDSPEERAFFGGVMKEALSLVCRPFYTDTFDFGDPAFMDDIYAYGEKAARMPEFRNLKAPRGTKDGIYINRTYFGLYAILSQLGCQIQTQRYMGVLTT